MTELDPQAQSLIDAAVASGLPPVYQLPVDESRARMRAAFIQGEPEPIFRRQDLEIPRADETRLRARAYYPSDDGSLGLLVYFHGGGWIVNDLDTHDRLCSILAKAANCVVLSVDARRSPEVKYPEALDDPLLATRWAASAAGQDALAADTSRVAVGGDSSGATFAAAVAKKFRDDGGPSLVTQFLMYPVTDYLEPATDSYVERGVGYSLNRDFMVWAWNAYLPLQWERSDPYLFPLEGDLGGLPPAIIATAEFDPLRDEGIKLAEKLESAGVPVTHVHAHDQMHGFAMQTRAITRAAQLVADLSGHLRSAMG